MAQATFQQLQATLCCPDGKCLADDPGAVHVERCAAYAYDDEAYAVLALLEIELPGRPLKQGERA